MLNNVNINELGMRKKMEDEIVRFSKFHKGVPGIKGKVEVHQDIDLKDYAKYVLREGTNEEKRELMGCFKSKITISKKMVSLNN
jgi:hypothetical protein